MVAENCFQVFYHLFNSQTNHLTANFNAKIINVNLTTTTTKTNQKS